MMTTSQEDPRRYYLAYLTANDLGSFNLDHLHFRNMARRDPGVPFVEVVVAVSEVLPFSATDRRSLELLAECAAQSQWLGVSVVIWKGNVGRDFGSARACLKWIAESARDEDFVMVRNRSAYGPLCGDWYGAYIAQYRRHPNTGLVGSTINLVGHPKIPPGEVWSPHVQTYVYLSKWRHLEPLVADYPGSSRASRPEVIAQGEIGLSRRIMGGGLRISSLCWPDRAFDTQSPDDLSLPHTDIKSEVRGLPFLYKQSGYTYRPQALAARAVWVMRGLSHKSRGEAEGDTRICHISSRDYG
jgi:hypothetical protein